jgi:hypothetical protein
METVTWYRPGGISPILYLPCESLCTERVRPVSVFVAETVAPATTASDESLTNPDNALLLAWPKPLTAAANIAEAKIGNNQIFFMIPSRR